MFLRRSQSRLFYLEDFSQLFNSAEQKEGGKVSVEMFYIVYQYHAIRNNIVNVKVFVF